MSKKVLIITYYWPPAGGAGVQRWLKFVKYLPQYGWDPVIYTVKNGEYPVLDHSLEKEIPQHIEIIRRKIIEPYSWYKKFIGQKPEERINTGFMSKSEKPARKEKIARWIRGNLFIPDARKFWVSPSVKFLTNYLSNAPVEAIISTGPPHSMHLIALKLKERVHIPWFADFRDPWTRIDFYDDLLLTRIADKKHHMLERKVITAADRILSVNKQMIKDFDQVVPGKTSYLPNGFDQHDQTKIAPKKENKFNILYAGSLTPTRNPETFWKVIFTLVRENEAFAQRLQITFIGHTDISARLTADKYQLNPYIRWKPYMPHQNLLEEESHASLLLLLINRVPNAGGIVTGKLYEYLMAGNPILCIGPPHGEAAEIIQECKAGDTVDFDHFSEMKEIVLKWFTFYQNNKNFSPSPGIRKYTREKLSQDLAELLNDTVRQ